MRNYLDILTQRWFRWSIALLGLFVVMSKANQRHQQRSCVQLLVDVEQTVAGNNHFINKEAIINQLAGNRKEMIVGTPKKFLDLMAIEAELQQVPFVKKANVSIDVLGRLLVNIEAEKPIARVVKRNGNGLYISDGGQLLPLSANYTARVPIVYGAATQYFKNQNNLAADSLLSDAYSLIRYVDKHPFWSKEIAAIEIATPKHVRLYLQVGKQVVDFGDPANLESGFFKLAVFLNKILPARGWNKYDTVNLDYKNQIICF